MAEQRLNVIFSADGSQLKKTLQELKQDQELLNQEIADFTQALRKNDAAIASKQRELNSLSKSSGSYRTEVTRLNRELEALRAKNVNLTTGLKGAKTEFASTSNQVKDYVRSANQLRSINEQAQLSFTRLTSVNALAGQAVSQLRGQFVSLATTMLSGFIGGFVANIVSQLIPALSGASDQAAKFKRELEGIKRAADEAQDSLDFGADIDKLKSKLTGTDFQADLSGFAIDTQKNIDKIAAAQKELQNLINRVGQLRKEEGFKSLFESQEKIIKDATRDNEKIEIQSQIRIREENKKAFEKRLADFEKFQNDIIARGKELAKFFESILIVPQFTILDTKVEAFAKAKKFIDELAAGLFKIKMPDWKITPNIIVQANEIPVIIEPVFNQKTQDQFFEELKKDFQGPYKVDLSIDIAVKREQFKKEFDEAVKSGGLREALDAFQKELKDSQGKGTGVFVGLSEDIKNAAIAMNTILTPAFTEFFDAILEGENPIKAFFDSIVQSINQVIRKLIQAAIQAAILSAITGTSFGGNFLKGLSGLLGGGGIAAPSFRGGGSIAFTLSSNVTFTQRGSDLIGVLNQGNALLGRVG